MSNPGLSAAPMDTCTSWQRESVLSTRSLSYVSNAGSIQASLAPHIQPEGQPSSRTAARKGTMDSVSEDSDLEMPDARREGSMVLNDIPELPESVANSLLFELPREIRDRIYALCLSSRDGLPVEWPRPTQWPMNNPYDLSPALIRTCRIIYDESAPLLYTLNHLTFHHPSDANVFVRAFASPTYGRQISNLSLHIKAQDMRTWMPYLTSTDEVRSLKADFPNLKELGVRYRSTKWHHQHTPEANLKAWSDDSRLDELIDGLRHVFLPRETPERELNDREFQDMLIRNPASFRDGDRLQFRDRLLKIHKARMARSHSTPRGDAPVIQVCCACRVHQTHFNALTIKTEPNENLDSQSAPPPPVREGEIFRGFTAVDLQNGVKQLQDPELGQASVARTPYVFKNGILLALEIHCLDPKRDATERAA